MNLLFRVVKNIIDCGYPKSIDYGKVNVKASEDVYYYGKKVALTQQIEYTCDDDYTFTDASQPMLTCNQSSNSFEPILPTCARGKLFVSQAHSKT